MNAMNIARRIYGAQKDVPMIYGHVPGVRLSEVFKGRNTMPCNMLHQNHMTGIHYPTWKDTESGKKSQTETVASPAIVMSGGYEDDEEMGDDEWSTGAALSAEAAALKGHDDAFWYTGDGGNDLLAGKSQIKDQHDERGNRALLRSQAMGIPVRVLRGRAEKDTPTDTAIENVHGRGAGKYNTYDGLYTVEKHTYLKGMSGHMVYRFMLKRLAGQKSAVSAPVLHSMVGNMSTKYTRANAGYNPVDFYDPKTGKRKDKKEFKMIKRKPHQQEGLLCADISNGQEGRPIPCFNEIDDEKLPAEFKYIKSSILVGDARSFKAKHDYPSSSFERFDETETKLLSECPCVAMTAEDGMIAPGTCGEGYTSLGTIWRARDIIFECQACQHDSKGGLLQNRVVQKGITQHLEVFKTETAGWGMRCFNEIPAGAFICTYEGEIMTSDECEERAKQPGKTDRYYFDLEIKAFEQRAQGDMPESSSEEEEEEEQDVSPSASHVAEPEEVVEPAAAEEEEEQTGRGGRSRRAASKRKQSYNEDDYYKSVGGDALVAKGRKARKAAEEQRIEAEQQARAQKRKAKKKRGGARSNPKPDPNPCFRPDSRPAFV